MYLVSAAHAHQRQRRPAFGFIMQREAPVTPTSNLIRAFPRPISPQPTAPVLVPIASPPTPPASIAPTPAPGVPPASTGSNIVFASPGWKTVPLPPSLVINPNRAVGAPPPQPPQPTYPPAAAAPVANQGTPVPAGYPTSQIFVNTDGSFWQYSTSAGKWMSVGTPYGTGAAATPAAPAPPSSSGAPTTNITATVAPAPSTASSTPTVTDTGYQAILDWLNEDTLLATIGFSGIPNWITGSAIVLLGWKVTSGATKKGGR